MANSSDESFDATNTMKLRKLKNLSISIFNQLKNISNSFTVTT